MRFFAVSQSNPNKPNYGMAQGVFRFVPEMPERYDRDTDTWVFYPEMVLGFTGLGGASDYFEVTEEFATGCIEAWRHGQSAPTVPQMMT